MIELSIESVDLGEPIGDGGFGEVYVVDDPVAGRKLALKKLWSNTRKSRQRFKQEAQGLSAINHPNVMSYYGHTTIGDEAYLVFEYIEGISLTNILDLNGYLSERQVRKIAEGLLGALEALNRAGVVHRDISPNNIMMATVGGTVQWDKPILIDFGSATKRLGGSATYADDSYGTVGYQSQAHIYGDPRHRDDLYSLGCVLHDALCGRTPLHPKNNQERSTGITMKPCKDKALWNVVSSLLSYEASARPKNAKAALVLLNAPIEEEQINHIQPTQAKPERFAWPVFASVAVLSFGFGALIAHQMKPSKQPNSTPTAPKQVTKVIRVENPKTQAQLVSAIVENRALKIIKGPKVQYRTRIVTKTAKTQPKKETEKKWKLKYRTYEGGRN